MRIDSLSEIIAKGLNYLAAEQRSLSYETLHMEGIWMSTMHMRTSYLLLGNRNPVPDLNCFAQAGILNALSGIARYSDYEDIMPMLDKGVPDLLEFYNGETFNFWLRVKVKGRHSFYRKTPADLMVRRPLYFKITNPYIRKAANVCDDNDDTSQGYLALRNYNALLKRRGDSMLPEKFGPHNVLNRYLDENRLSRHFYNVFNGNIKETGGYLTWQCEEEAFPSWNIPRLLINNTLFLTPFSTTFPYMGKAYMPYGANDLDAVVNANVIKTLAAFGFGADSSLTAGACKVIEMNVKARRWSRAGVYYPNRYQFHASVAAAYRAGVSRLEYSVDALVEHILQSQRDDGSFVSRRIVNKGDILQSTVNAFLALVKAGNYAERNTEHAIERSLVYLLSQAVEEKTGQIYWPGGVFFSGGTVIRNTLYWKSDAYITAILLEGLAIYRDYLIHKLG